MVFINEALLRINYACTEEEGRLVLELDGMGWDGLRYRNIRVVASLITPRAELSGINIR